MKYVSPLPQRFEERARSHREHNRQGININAKLITDDEFLTELNASLIRRENPNYCLLQNYTSYEEAIEWVKNIEENDCRLLSHFPKYVDKAGNVITFDDAF